MKLLKIVNNDMEAELLLSVLRSNSIEGTIKHNDEAAAAKIYCGQSNIGAEIYVSDDDFDAANEIINSEIDNSDFENQVEISMNNEPAHAENNIDIKKITGYIALIVILLIVIFLITRL